MREQKHIETEAEDELANDLEGQAGTEPAASFFINFFQTLASLPPVHFLFSNTFSPSLLPCFPLFF